MSYYLLLLKIEAMEWKGHRARGGLERLMMDKAPVDRGAASFSDFRARVIMGIVR